MLPKSNLIQRILTATVAIPLIVGALYWHAWSYFLFCFLMVLCTMVEFYNMIRLPGPLPLWGTLNGLALYTLVFLYVQGKLDPRYSYLLIPMLTSIYLIKLYQSQPSHPVADIAYTLFGILYISVPFTLLHLIAFIKGYYSYEIVIGLFLILWANDTGAYLVGSMLGKTPLFKRISPNKTWEGSLGGAALTLGTSDVLAGHFTILSFSQWMMIAGISIIAGTYGDLIESLFKRSLGIKHASHAIPGHGGFLDRYDSFLLAIPFILLLLKLLPST